MATESKWKTTWIPWMCWGLGIAILAMALMLFIEERGFRQTGIRAEAQVVDLYIARSAVRRYGRPLESQMMIVQYVAMGEIHVRSVENPGGRFRVGDRVTIVHAPNNPMQVTLEGATGSSIYLLVMSPIVASMGFMVKYGDMKRTRR